MFKVKINTANEAFSQSPETEIARILRVIVDKLDSGRDGGTCVDINGNIVGSWEITNK